MKTKYDTHGALYFNPAGKLVDHNGKEVPLCGYSIPNPAVYPQYINRDFFESLRDKWNVDMVRLTMFTDKENGYCVSSEADKDTLIHLIDKGVRSATELGLYAIVDWHISNTTSPLTQLEDAADFFRRTAKRYRAYGNVIYTICSMDNADCTWSDIKKYADTIIPIIREYDQYGIILVGIPNCSHGMDILYNDPVKGYSNVGYVLPFYADAAHNEMQSILTDSASLKLPVFVSEFVVCDPDMNNIAEKS